MKDSLHQRFTIEMLAVRDNLLTALGKHANQIASLESQVTALRVNNTATPPTTHTKPAGSKKTTTPAKSYRDAAAKATDETTKPQETKPEGDGFTPVRNNPKPASKPKLINHKYPISEREIIITFEKATDAPPFTPMQADIALMHVNKAITNSKEITHPPFIRARFSFTNSLILTTGLDHRGIDYESYLSIVTQPLHYFGTPIARVQERL